MIFSILGKSKAQSEGTASGNNIGTETIRRWREVAAKLQTTMFPDSSAQDDHLTADRSSMGPTEMGTGDFDMMSDEGPLFESISMREPKPVQWPDPRAAVALQNEMEESSDRTQQLSIDSMVSRQANYQQNPANYQNQGYHTQVVEQVKVIDDVERIRIIAPSKAVEQDREVERAVLEPQVANASFRQPMQREQAIQNSAPMRPTTQTPHTRIMDSRGSNPSFTSMTNPAAAKVTQFPIGRSNPPIAQSNSGLTLEEDLRRRFGANVKSALGPGTIIEGNFRFDSPVCIDGTLIGEVTSTSVLIVGENATVNATIKVGTLVVLGSVIGTVQAQDLVEIRAGGSLEGDITTERIAIEDGGWFEGRVTPRIIMRGANEGVIELEERTYAGEHHEVEMPSDDSDLEY